MDKQIDPDVHDVFNSERNRKGTAKRTGKTLTCRAMGSEPITRAKLSVTDAFQRAIETRPNALTEMALKVLDNVTGPNPDFRFVKELWDRFDGKTVNRTEITGADGGPINLTKPLEDMSDDELDLFIARLEARESPPLAEGG